MGMRSRTLQISAAAAAVVAVVGTVGWTTANDIAARSQKNEPPVAPTTPPPAVNTTPSIEEDTSVVDADLSALISAQTRQGSTELLAENNRLVGQRIMDVQHELAVDVVRTFFQTGKRQGVKFGSYPWTKPEEDNMGWTHTPVEVDPNYEFAILRSCAPLGGCHLTAHVRLHWVGDLTVSPVYANALMAYPSDTIPSVCGFQVGQETANFSCEEVVNPRTRPQVKSMLIKLMAKVAAEGSNPS